MSYLILNIKVHNLIWQAYMDQERRILQLMLLMKFYEFEREPVAESYIMTGIAYFSKRLTTRSASIYSYSK